MLDSHLIAKTRPVARKENTIKEGNWRITVLTNRLFRMEQDVTGRFCDEATQSVWFRDLPAVEFRVQRKSGKLLVETDAVTLVVGKDMRNSFVILNGKRIAISNKENLMGTYRTLDRCQGNLYIDKNNEITKLKLETGVISKTGVATFDDGKSLLLNAEGKIVPREVEETDLYVFAYGHDYRDAVRDLYLITGNVPMVPKYALGNWWSRYHAYTEKEYLHVLDRLRERDVPLTVATIDMDWHWSTTLDERKKITESGKDDDFHGGAKGWTGYSWNTDLFPDYKSFLKKIKERDLKITLNLHPAKGVRWFEDMYPEMAKAVGIDPATEQAVEFDFTSDDFINAYFRILHKPYEHDGVDFWWIDWQQGSKSALVGLDPLWALNHYHTYDIALEHQPLILSRYCGVGSHRYPLGFSGDTTVTWESLNYLPYFTATASNVGYTWWSHDIGGHMWGYKDDELYARYLQFGAFSPINRLHCSCDRLATKEPLYYMNGSGLIGEEFLRLRHRMIPFLYSAAYETTNEGLALIEPMYYMAPEDPEAYRCPNQYLFGRQLIVAPVTHKGDRKRMAVETVWLPEGHWTDIFTGDEYDGGKTVEMVRWMDSMPVLAKEGGFFPLDGRKHTNRTDNPDILDVLTFNGNGSYVLHEDNGEKRAQTCFTSVAGEAEDGRKLQTVQVKVTGDAGVVPERAYRFEFRNIRSEGEVKVVAAGKEIPAVSDCDAFLTVEIPAGAAGDEFTVNVLFTPMTREALRKQLVTESFLRIQGVYSRRMELRKELLLLPDEEWCGMLNEQDWLTSAEKKRILEVLNLAPEENR